MSESMRKKLCYVSVGLMAFCSAILISASYINYYGSFKLRIISYVCSSLFWVTLIAAWVILFVCYKTIKNNNALSKMPGIIKFFSNKYAIIADISTIVILIMVLIVNATVKKSVVVLVFVSLFIFAFQIRIFLNSNVYKYTFNLKNNERGQDNEKC